MIIDSTEKSLSINGLKVLEKIKIRYFDHITSKHVDHDNAVKLYLHVNVSMAIAKQISYWILKHLKLNNAIKSTNIDSVKYILSTQSLDKPNTFIAQDTPEKERDQLAIVNDDQSIDFSMSGIYTSDVMIAIAIWIGALDENYETTINGIDPLFVFSRNLIYLDYSNKLLNYHNPVKYINLETKEELEIIYSKDYEIKVTPFSEMKFTLVDDNDVEVKPQVKSVVNGVPVVETMTQYQLENQSKIVPYIAVHTSENKEDNKVDNIYDVYIENDYVMAAILNLMHTCSFIDVSSDIDKPLLIVNEKYKETATYEVGQIIQIKLTKDLNNHNKPNIKTMTIKEAIAHLVELSAKKGLDSLIGISE